MDFLLKTANLTGGDTRKAPKNTLFSKSRHTPEGKGPPYDNPSQSSKSRQTLKICQSARVPPTPTPQNPPNHAKPSQSFLTKIPIGLNEGRGAGRGRP